MFTINLKNSGAKIATNMFSAVLLSFSCMLIVGCNENEDTPQPEVDVEEITPIIEGTVTYSTDGLTKSMEEIVYLTELASPCGTSFDSTTNYVYNGNFITADYQTNWSWNLNCEGNLPATFTYGRTTNGQYETNRMASNDQAAGTWTASALISGPTLQVSGTYQREGTQTSKVHNQSLFNSTVTLTVTSISIDKQTGRVIDGHAIYLIEGSTAPRDGNPASFSVEGTIIFLGNGQATITINGTPITIDLY